MIKKIVAAMLCLLMVTGIAAGCKKDPEPSTPTPTPVATGKTSAQIKSMYESFGYTVIISTIVTPNTLTATKGSENLKVYMYTSDDAAKEAKGTVQHVGVLHEDGNNLYYGSIEAIYIYANNELPPAKTGKDANEIKSLFETFEYTVNKTQETGYEKLVATKEGRTLTAYHYETDEIAEEAKAAVDAAQTNVSIDGRNLYWGDNKSVYLYVNNIEFDGMLESSPATISLLRSVQIANATIWKYCDYENWKTNGVITVAPKYNLTTGQRVGGHYNCYEYTNVLEMLVTALQSLAVIKEIEDVDPVYENLFKFYEQIVYDASDKSLQYYSGTATVTSSTQTAKAWRDVVAVGRSEVINLDRDVSGKATVYDDQMWLIRCFLETYKVLDDNDTVQKAHKDWYLQRSEYLTEYCLDGWDQSKRDNGEEWGGITWGPFYDSKHTCSNGPIISPLVWLSEIYETKATDTTVTVPVRIKNTGATLAEIVQNQTFNKVDYYLDYAKKVYDFCYSNLRRTDNIYGDAIGSGRNTTNFGVYTTTSHGGLDQKAHSYNAGSPLSGVADLYRVTNEQRYLVEAIDLADASFSYFADPNVKEGYYQFDQSLTGKAEFTSCLLRAWVELKIHDIYDTSHYVNAFADNLNYGYDNYYNNGFLPMDLLFGWNQGMTTNEVYDNKDDMKISSLRTFNYSAQFAWISLSQFHDIGLI